MQTLWFITNPGSGSTSKAKCAAITALFAEHALTLAGTTDFPEQSIPDGAALDAAGVDTVVLFAGDGTINAALCKLADWGGAFLILPGGTMNLLARLLHDSPDPHAIVAAAVRATRRVALPYIEAGPHRAFVGLILGPAAHWFRAREAARAGRPARLAAAARFAWRRTFGRGVRVEGAARLKRGYQAVFVRPEPDGLSVAAVDARDWRSIVELGWTWLTGEWVAAQAVTRDRVPVLRVGGRRPVLALFDGEPETLAPGTRITGGTSRRAFIATRTEDAA